MKTNIANIKANGWDKRRSWESNVISCARDPWAGSLATRYERIGEVDYPVVMDERGHAVFGLVDGIPPAVWSARAAARELRGDFVERDRRTLIALTSDYAPADDTQGSIEGGKPNDPAGYAHDLCWFLNRDVEAEGLPGPFMIDSELPLFREDGNVYSHGVLRTLLAAIVECESGAGTKMTGGGEMVDKLFVEAAIAMCVRPMSTPI